MVLLLLNRYLTYIHFAQLINITVQIPSSIYWSTIRMKLFFHQPMCVSFNCFLSLHNVYPLCLRCMECFIVLLPGIDINNNQLRNRRHICGYDIDLGSGMYQLHSQCIEFITLTPTQTYIICYYNIYYYQDNKGNNY